MQAAGPDGPIVMVNLLKFRDRAEYRDGRETSLTGREAYDLYARDVSKLVVDYGGKILYAGDTTFLALGEATASLGRGGARALSLAQGAVRYVDLAGVAGYRRSSRSGA